MSALRANGLPKKGKTLPPFRLKIGESHRTTGCQVAVSKDITGRVAGSSFGVRGAFRMGGRLAFGRTGCR